MQASVRHERRGAVAFVTLDRPAQLNAVDDGLVRDLLTALRRAGDEAAGAVVLSGAGRAFCAGHDFRQPPEEVEPAAMARLERLADVTRTVRGLPAPVVAAVHGYALGAGCEIALCCDLVVAQRDAVFGFPEVSVGLGVTGGISRLLPLAVGAAKAKELVLLGERFGADEAARLGLVNAVVDDAVAQAAAWAEQLAGRPRLALAFAKAALDRGPEGDLETAHAFETAASLALMNTPEAVAAASDFRSRHPGR
ncbi:MAG: enoyl-CoA hydratase/isomerase family protein [Acidimicrobiales bacterium]